MPTDIKALGPGDEGVFRRIGPDVFDLAVDEQSAREFLADPRHHIAVAIDEGHVVGFASGVHYFHPDKPRPEMFINEVGVASTHRGLGIASGLLTALFARAREVGCAEAWVLTDRDNQAAMRLYASSGGVEAPNDQVMFTFHLDSKRRQIKV
jgi:ribosomal protein S18 acetylase RimI-like enzyme